MPINCVFRSILLSSHFSAFDRFSLAFSCSYGRRAMRVREKRSELGVPKTSQRNGKRKGRGSVKSKEWKRENAQVRKKNSPKPRIQKKTSNANLKQKSPIRI